MKGAADYLANIRALIVRNPEVVHWRVVREETEGNIGLFRYRLTLRDGDLLEIFERFDIVEGQVQARKYSFHWQDAAGQLHKRWDNASHHPELSTSPCHVHENSEENVLPHGPISAKDVLAFITKAANQE